MGASRLVPSVAVLGATALAGLAAGGCASDTHTTSAPRAAATASATGSAAAAAATPSALAAKLLNAADLPAGWSMDATATNPVMDTACPLLNPAVWDGALGQHAEADLTAGMAGPFLVEQIAVGNSQEVGRAWQAFVAAIPKCTTYTHAGSDGSSTFTITRADFPTYGTASYGFGMTLQVSGGVSASGSIVVARTDDAVVLVYLVGVADVPKPLVEQIVSKAVAKA